MPTDSLINDGKLFVEHKQIETRMSEASGTNDTIDRNRSTYATSPTMQNQFTTATDELTPLSASDAVHTSLNSHKTSAVTTTTSATSSAAKLPHKRVKRLHAFRPLFVYRQEQVERQRIYERQYQRRKAASKTDNKILSPSKNCRNCCCCNDQHRRN